MSSKVFTEHLHMPGAVLGSGDLAINQRDQTLYLVKCQVLELDALPLGGRGRQ